MKELWSLDKSAVKIYGDYSPHPVIVTKDVYEHFGGETEKVFHSIQGMMKEMPRLRSSECHPFSMIDITFADENSYRGTSGSNRHWKFGTLSNSREFVTGYYYMSEDGTQAIFSGGTVWRL